MLQSDEAALQDTRPFILGRKPPAEGLTTSECCIEGQLSGMDAKTLPGRHCVLEERTTDGRAFL